MLAVSVSDGSHGAVHELSTAGAFHLRFVQRQNRHIRILQQKVLYRAEQQQACSRDMHGE